MINKATSNEFLYSHNLTGCKVSIRDLFTDELYFETTVKDHDKSFQTITIKPPSDGSKLPDKISAVIYAHGDMIRYSGTVRAFSMSTSIEIALFNAQTKEDREHTRYEVYLRGIVETIYICETAIELRRPVEVEVLNISSGGVLIRSLRNTFKYGISFKLKLFINNAETTLHCDVIRISDSGNLHSDCGCKFIEG